MSSIDQPPTVTQQESTATPQQQWSTLMDQIIHEEAMASKYQADVMNFTGAAANAKSSAENAKVRVAALRVMLKLLHSSFTQQGFKFIDDEWVKE